MPTAREQLLKTGQIAARIKEQQEFNPGYEDDILSALVSTELKRLEEEQARFDPGPQPMKPMECASLLADRDYMRFAMRCWRGVAGVLAILWAVCALLKGGTWAN